MAWPVASFIPAVKCQLLMLVGWRTCFVAAARRYLWARRTLTRLANVKVLEDMLWMLFSADL